MEEKVQVGKMPAKPINVWEDPHAALDAASAALLRWLRAVDASLLCSLVVAISGVGVARQQGSASDSCFPLLDPVSPFPVRDHSFRASVDL
jgi:hypothetical protein